MSDGKNASGITPENVVRHELIGLRVRVAESTDPMLRGLSGIVVDETHNMLVVETKKTGKQAAEKRLSKQNSVFIFALPNKVKVRVEGRLLVGRPEDRIKKRFDRW
ncbi:MAG: ribonuclease P protein subunit [Candidatus Aenigmarchaeota archaeon]|nr:ribonuclease P protein subunit [Candidatus Aenigmarchaeota archaeon]